MLYRGGFTAVFFHNAGRHATAPELTANLRQEKKKTVIKPEAQAASSDPATLKKKKIFTVKMILLIQNDELVYFKLSV